jgi:hypothetical protein
MNTFAISIRKHLFWLATLSFSTAGTALASPPSEVESPPGLEMAAEDPSKPYAPTVVGSRSATAPVPGPAPESFYATREQQSQQQAKFEGGSVGVYLSGTTLVVLLIVLIILI